LLRGWLRRRSGRISSTELTAELLKRSHAAQDTIAAFIKRRSPCDDKELDEFCRTSGLANFKRPRQYVFVNDIPKSPVGKLLRRKLVAGEFEAEGKSRSEGTAA